MGSEMCIRDSKKNIKRTKQAAQPNHAEDAPNPDGKNPKSLKEPKEKDEELKTQKAPGNTHRENADPKTKKRPEATQGVKLNSLYAEDTRRNPRGEPRKPENCR